MAPVFLFLLFLSLAAIPPGATNEGQSIHERITKANEGVEGLIHGDIVENNNKNADPCTNSGCLWPKNRGYVTVPYVIERRHFSRSQQNFIKSVLRTFEESTCIRFVRRKRQADYVHFISDSGCWSYLGRVGGRQWVSLQRNGCLYKGTVQHEVLHFLGFHHEHSRSDRDDHVVINFENIQPGRESNFNKVETNNLGTPYDFDSVMQYYNYAFSINDQPTIIDKNDPDHLFGFAEEMSSNDINRINNLYQC